MVGGGGDSYGAPCELFNFTNIYGQRFETGEDNNNN